MEPKDAAFPRPHSENPNTYVCYDQEGIDVRTYIATAALQGMVAGRKELMDKEDAPCHARCAVWLADALIAELNK